MMANLIKATVIVLPGLMLSYALGKRAGYLKAKAEVMRLMDEVMMIVQGRPYEKSKQEDSEADTWKR